PSEAPPASGEAPALAPPASAMVGPAGDQHRDGRRDERRDDRRGRRSRRERGRRGGDRGGRGLPESKVDSPRHEETGTPAPAPAKGGEVATESGPPEDFFVLPNESLAKYVLPGESLAKYAQDTEAESESEQPELTSEEESLSAVEPDEIDLESETAEP